MLGQRNLIRGKHYGLPSGQDVAQAMGIPVLTNKQLGLSAKTYPDFNGEAPLWFYMLAESKITENGARLGPVGGRIIAEVFLTQIAIDPDSYLNARRPFTPSVEHTGPEFTIGDFLTFAGVVELEEPTTPLVRDQRRRWTSPATGPTPLRLTGPPLPHLVAAGRLRPRSCTCSWSGIAGFRVLGAAATAMVWAIAD